MKKVYFRGQLAVERLPMVVMRALPSLFLMRPANALLVAVSLVRMQAI